MRSSDRNIQWLNLLKVNIVLNKDNRQVRYSISWFIQHLLDQIFATYHNFLDIRTLYLTCILVYLVTSWTDLTTSFVCGIHSCSHHTFYSLFITTCVTWCVYNLKKKTRHQGSHFAVAILTVHLCNFTL
jgi:hypothetical protein